jgi:hypothetical protein
MATTRGVGSSRTPQRCHAKSFLWYLLAYSPTPLLRPCQKISVVPPCIFSYPAEISRTASRPAVATTFYQAGPTPGPCLRPRGRGWYSPARPNRTRGRMARNRMRARRYSVRTGPGAGAARPFRRTSPRPHACLPGHRQVPTPPPSPCSSVRAAPAALGLARPVSCGCVAALDLGT